MKSEVNNIFFKFLNNEISIENFETNIYNQSELESQLEQNTFQELLEFNYRNEKSNSELKKIIIEKVIGKGQFEKWKLMKLLSNFITDVKNAPIYLDKMYNLFLGQNEKNGNKIYEYRFLGHLGLNYFYWIEEGYLRANYGEKWKDEYEKLIQNKEIETEHKKLKPTAELILKSLKNNQIEINNNGTYKITENLKVRLEK